MNESKKTARNYYVLALILGIVFHGVGFWFTFTQTYDSYVHLFFSDHYAKFWFDNWEYRWYTGFTITSYPPLVHHAVALLSYVMGLKLAFYSWTIFVFLFFIRGVFHFSKLLVSRQAAGMAAILAVFSPSIVEAIHVFGQIPSFTGLTFLLNACPEIYKWFRFKQTKHLLMALSFLSVTTVAHHVTTIFGMVFFVLPIIGLATIDNSYERTADGGITLRLPTFLKKAIATIPRAAAFGLSTIFLCIAAIYPYWHWVRTDPIKQISIPHGSRDSFLLEPNMGLIFFIIPWGILLLFLSFIFLKSISRRNTFIGISIILAFILGTGGTTPVPKFLLGENAFNILTLDRFTFWASILSLPFWGLFMHELIAGSLKKYLVKHIAPIGHKILLSLTIIVTIASSIFILNLGNIRPMQPKKIDIEPITRFLERDQHDQWRYLCLGFGDQMAWLSANTNALTVDGNYHSARRLPALTSRAVERLENAKYKGEEGLGALREFLVNADAYHLKYVFNNDKFYEPQLFFAGWNKVQTLDNSIQIWEKPDIAPLPSLLPRKNIPSIQRFLWGVLPLFCFFSMLLLFNIKKFYRQKTRNYSENALPAEQLIAYNQEQQANYWHFHSAWITSVLLLTIGGFSLFGINEYRNLTPQKTIFAYYDALDFRDYQKAHTHINPKQKISFEQFILEHSLEDGVLASYAKLDALDIEINDRFDTYCSANVNATWVTSLGTYETEHHHELEKVNGKWYLASSPKSPDIPPDQFMSQATIALHNQGRRVADVGNTRHEDILDRPMMAVLEVNLVQLNGQYHVLGMLQNTDNVPAYISVNAQIFDQKNKTIDSQNANDLMIHQLNPKEISPFLITFPDSIQQMPPIHTFGIACKSLVNDAITYKQIGLQNIDIQRDEINCEFFNFGTNEVSIPQVLAAYFNENGKIIWVDKQFAESGVRPQRKREMTIEKTNLENGKLILEGKKEQVIINGRQEPIGANYYAPQPYELRLFHNSFTQEKKN